MKFKLLRASSTGVPGTKCLTKISLGGVTINVHPGHEVRMQEVSLYAAGEVVVPLREKEKERGTTPICGS